jgi:Tfp pilus assembly PilM family ATPase
VASWLVLDWDQDQFHVLCAQSARRGAQITRGFTWTHPEPFTPSTAERVGKALGEFLKAEKIAPAPVIVGIGRDRIFLKELRFPAVAAHEEASLVRFQTGKEMAEAVDNYAIDYANLNDGTGNDRQVITVAARRDIVTMIQTLCQAAGVKLHAITPKLFGVTSALERAIQPNPSPLQPKNLNVVLTIGQRWAELCFFRGDRLVQSQALANGSMLASEVKRNLAVFQAQHAVNLDLEGPSCLYVFGDDAAILQGLQSGLSLPLTLLDPLKQEPEVAAEVKNPAHFAGAVGLATLWSQSIQKPVNLATPKRQAAPSNVTQRHLVLYGAAALTAALLVAVMVFANVRARSEIARLTTEKIAGENELSTNKQERANVDAYREWEQTTVPWLDEFYDLSARNPYREKFRINQLQATTLSTTGPKKAGSKDAVYIGKITMTGVDPSDPSKGDNYLKALVDSMSNDRHLVVQNIDTKKPNDKSNNRDFTIDILIARQDAKKYTTHLVVPSRPIVRAKDKEELPNPEVEPDDGGDNQ